MLSMIISVQYASAQYSHTYTLSDNSTVTVDINLASVIPETTSCEWGYNYNIKINYRITFSSPNHPRLTSIQITGLADNRGGNFTMTMKKKGSGEFSQTTTSNPWTDKTDCNTITVEDLGFGNLTLVVQESGKNEQTEVLAPGSGDLPIELLSFTAQEQLRTVVLNWTTATEENNEYFTIERSQDGASWESVMIIPGAGNSNRVLDYEAVDYEPLEGTAYYRLKQTDYNGDFSYSKLVAVNDVKERATSISLWPNPTSGSVYVKVENVELNEVEVYNTMGQNVSSRVFIQKSGENQFTVDLSSLPTGIYFVRTPNATAKVMKQE